MDKKKRKKGISLRKINLAVTAFALIIVAVFILSTVTVLSRYAGIKESITEYLGWQKTVLGLAEGSNYLTDQVRAFTVTGDKKYLDNYFFEANVLRRRDSAVEMIEEKFSGSIAPQKLNRAMDASMTLMEREFYAMRLTVSAFGYDVSEYPEQVQNVVLSDADLALTREERHTLAENMVFDSVYGSYKTVIETEIDECIEVIIGTAEQMSERSLDSLSFILKMQTVLLALVVLAILYMIFVTSKTVVRPLVNAVPQIRNGKKLPVSGAREYRFLAQTYNKILESNRQQKSLLTYEATHDNLTNAYNRRGFKEICENRVFGKYAFLMIDVDNFKMINDMHGHDAGDRILVRLVDELRTVFRSDDIICRLGGDEFVVLMDRFGDTPEHRDKIADKIAYINEVLADPEDSCPPAAISVGAAFGTGDLEIGDIHINADRALYAVKNSGKRNCAFFD
ncbi:MAG: GGDEF domain-containing protein [Clostridia bacterium]|nr:GGDEF domain-containing protein [Clostridia bacterium]